jgi:hypothetical protein
MFPKHRLAYPLVFCLLLIFISAGLFYLVSSLLPAVLESKIISIFKKDSGLNDFTLDIQQLGLRGASLGALRIGPPQDPALVIHSLRIAYSLGEIYRKRIKKMTAGGVELYCAYENGRWRLGSLDFDQFLKRLGPHPWSDAFFPGADRDSQRPADRQGRRQNRPNSL